MLACRNSCCVATRRGWVPKSPRELIPLLAKDKKVERGAIRIVLTRGIGSASLLDAVERSTLRKGFEEVCRGTKR